MRVKCNPTDVLLAFNVSYFGYKTAKKKEKSIFHCKELLTVYTRQWEEVEEDQFSEVSEE